MRDRYNREIDYLRVSVTDNCNLRCIYCMEDGDVNFLEGNDKLTNDEFLKVIKASSKVGIKKIRLTGGEPLVRKDIVTLVEDINEIDGIEEIYLTTNGILLGDKLEELYKHGLKGVNISLDSLKGDKFKEITRYGELSKVMEAIDKGISLGVKVKINTVIVQGINDDEIIDFINLTRNKLVDVRFIELMPIGVGKNHKGVSNDKIREIIKANYSNYTLIDKEKKSGPAAYIKLDGALGKVGFISAISNCFCEDCNRIRITSEGFLKQCLHFNYGTDLREIIRNGISEEELTKVIYKTIYDKPEKHLFNKSDKNSEIKFMNQIGG